ncbi:DUF6493 family protein [Roseimaritima ulvae]|uniref:Uncharacterized protein n=1 Tax=Roseimaritima ulvae TaxID=980254 RepID=A0A5B9QN30_9BACT|nr:DUF6493 family protein [Roseimaritima ulvae]QEG39282.1 hypothetical protein UC8_12450 [Roseimaritima ulvae]
MSDTQLQEILESGEQQRCVDFFRELPEPQRRALAPQTLAWYRQINRNSFLETKPGTFSMNPLLPTACVAVYATASFSELKKLGWSARPQGEVLFELLKDRRPDWLTPWVTTLLKDERYWVDWKLIRQLMAQGLIDKPDHPNYYLGMISGILGLFNSESTIEQALRDEPELFEDEVWKLFEYEGAGENSLANYDRFSRNQKWHDALLSCVQSGELPRDRLLTCSLDALALDFNHYRAKWFANFHDALEPSADEQREFAERYLQLLGNSAPNIVTWAFNKVETLSKKNVLGGRQLIDGLRPVLEAKAKGIVKKALQRISKAGQENVDTAHAASRAAISALAHEQPDVQAAAMDVIESWGDANDQDFVSQLSEYVDVVAPSLQKRLTSWLGSTPDLSAGDDASPDAAKAFDISQLRDIDPQQLELFRIPDMIESQQQGRVEIPAASFDGTDIPRLDSQQRVTPIQDLDELIEVCARVIEDDALVEDAERAIDAMARLCDQKPEDFVSRVGPVFKRATDKLKKDMAPFCGIGPADDLCGLIYAWCHGAVIETKKVKSHNHWCLAFEIDGETQSCFSENMNKALGFLSQRTLDVARRVASGTPTPLLSAPTHLGGWIDPQELVSRANAFSAGGSDAAPDTTDVCLALLRLAPEGRSEALAALTKSDGEWATAIRYGLGDDGVRIGKTPSLWIAAARCRSPWSDDPLVIKAFPDHGPDAGQAAAYSFICPTNKHKHTNVVIESEPPPPQPHDLSCVTVTLHAQRRIGRGLTYELGTAGGRTIGSVRWTAMVWLQARESYFAAAEATLADNIDWWEAQWQNKTLLEPLLDARTPLREMGMLLLTTALAAKDPGEHGLATDIAIAAIEDGRLGADNLGPMLTRLLPTGLIKPGRWQKQLAEVASVSTVHAAVVQAALQISVGDDPTSMPRDYAKLLDLLKELSIQLEQNITVDTCRDFLSQLKGSSKAAKIARQLLALEAGDAATSSRIMNEALQMRTEAVLRIGAGGTQ